jgi:hypothetical protein
MDVEAMGLHLPDTFTFACPAYAAGSHGATYPARNGNPGSVAISDLSLDRSDPDLRGIIAHEFAHAWDFHERGQTTECHADEVAASYGFHNPFAVC